MKALLVFLCVVAAARAAAIGDTYEQVIAEMGKPKSQMISSANRILNYPDASIQLRANLVVAVKLTKSPTKKDTPPSKDGPPSKEERTPPPVVPGLPLRDATILKNEQLSAINRVKFIVNQPVNVIQRTGDMTVSTFQPGWFHDGAITPDFNTVDIRSTQETTYDRYEYVTSNLNPGVAFLGREIEFNRMTKYFYEDLSLPKKKLSQSEMREINRLYRVIGRCDDQLRLVDP
jgi:hypothetical protein